MQVNSQPFLLFTGSSHPDLATHVAGYLSVPLGKVALGRFPDGEISLQIQENVRGKEVFVLQTIALDPHAYLMELLIMIDALKRASASSITAVVPYFGYCRQDRKDKPRVPITAKLVANLLVNAGATHLITMDLHASQIQGFFDIPVDHLSARPLLVEAVKSLNLSRLVVVAPDIGGVKLTRSYAVHLGVDFAVVDKHRINSSHVEMMAVIGDVKGKDVLLADDMCSTGETLVSAAKACQEKGARSVYAAVTHGLFVGDALSKIEQSGIQTVLVGDTIPVQERCKQCKKITVVPLSSLLGQAIHCSVTRESISSLS